MEVEMAKAWDEYVGDDGDPAVHPMFAAAFAAGWRAAIDDNRNEADGQRRRDECIGRYGA